jgi:hypothetical protein
MEQIVFYNEWQPLPKAEFNILAMVTEEGGSYSGNLSDMCRYLTVTPQTRNRNQLRSAIESLTSKRFLSCETRGRTYHLKVIPQETEVKLPKIWVQSVIQHDYSSESVAFAQVLKVFLWILQNRMRVVTNAMIAAELGISESTVCSAKNVLQYEYENIAKRKVSQKWGEGFRTLGQELAANAWWTEI